MFTLTDLEEIVKTAAMNSFLVHETLGEHGKKKERINAHGEIALTADLECGKAILDTLKNVNMPIRVYSEEDGIVNIGEGEPEYIGVLDGLDGTGAYTGAWKKFGRTNGRYGTLFGIFNGTNPFFSDYAVSVFMEHPTKTMFYATHNNGAWKMKIGGEPYRIHTSSTRDLTPQTSVIVDDLFDKILGGNLMHTRFIDKLSGVKIRDCGAAQTGYLEVATGNTDAVCELTRKGNLEPAAAYAIIREAGGEIFGRYSKVAESLGDLRYLEFGQKETDRHEFITGATSDLAKKIIERLESTNLVS